MSRKAAPGRSPAQQADAAYDEQGRPSKTQRKRESQDLQALGEAVSALPASSLQSLALPELLQQAIEELRRTRSHEGRRRQQQYIGKLMRSVDPEPLREAVAQARLGGARDALALHLAERWRNELMDSDEALTRWVGEHPHGDLQHLRALVRQARLQAGLQARQPQGPGAAARQDRGYRELFRYLREQLRMPSTSTPAAS